MHILPHLTLFDLESLAQSSPRIMRYTSVCLQRAERSALKPSPTLIAVGAMILWNSHEQIGMFQGRYFQAILGPLIAKFSRLAARRICISDLLLHIAASVSSVFTSVRLAVYRAVVQSTKHLFSHLLSCNSEYRCAGHFSILKNRESPPYQRGLILCGQLQKAFLSDVQPFFYFLFWIPPSNSISLSLRRTLSL